MEPCQPKPLATWNTARDAWETPGTEGLFCEHWDVFSETWPTSGSMRNGTVSPRPASVPATTASACSSSPGDEALIFLHTPDTMPDAPNAGSNTRSKPAGLGNQVAALGGEMLLPTPVASEGTKPSNTMGVARRLQTGQVFLTNVIVTLCGLDPSEQAV